MKISNSEFFPNYFSMLLTAQGHMYTEDKLIRDCLLAGVKNSFIMVSRAVDQMYIVRQVDRLKFHTK